MAVTFPNVSSSLQTSYLLAGSDKRSYSCWVSVPGPGTNNRYFQKGNGSNTGSEAAWQIAGASASGIVYARHNGSNVLTAGHQTASNVIPGSATAVRTPSHVCITHDQTSGTLTAPTIYINGTSVSLSTLTIAAGIAQNNTDAFYVGNRQNADRAFGTNRMGAFVIWNNAILTQSEVTQLSQGAPVQTIRPSALVLYLPELGINSQIDMTMNGPVTINGGALGNLADPGWRLYAPGLRW